MVQKTNSLQLAKTAYDFKLEEVLLSVERISDKPIDITDLIPELQIYESVDSRFLSGFMAVSDSIGLLDDIGFVVENCDTNMLKELEPWCSDIYGDWLGHKGYGVNIYIEEEQKDTQFDLSKKIHSDRIKPKNNVIVKFDCNELNQDNFQIIVNLSEILQESGDVGEMELGIFKLNIKSLKTYEKDLIVCKTN